MVNGHDSQNTCVICLGGTAVDGNRGGIIGGMAGHYLGAEAGDLAKDVEGSGFFGPFVLRGLF